MIGMFILSWAAAEMAKAREGERERGAFVAPVLELGVRRPGT